MATPPRPTGWPARGPRVLAACAAALLCAAALAVTALAGMAAGRGLAQTPDRDLDALLTEALAEMPATTGVVVTHLTSGRSAAVRGDQAFSPASVTKLPYLVRAIQMAERGELDLSRRTTLTRAHLRHGTGVLQFHDAGLAPTLGDLVTEMIITSDNTATDIVVDAIGGVAAVNAWLSASGYRRDAVVRPARRLPARAAHAARSGLRHADRRGDDRPALHDGRQPAGRALSPVRSPAPRRAGLG